MKTIKRQFLRLKTGDIMNRKKLFTALIIFVLVSILIITGTAVAKNKFTSSSGEKVQNTVNRINYTVSATEFTFRNADKNGMLECRTVITIEKTEPDFYGMLHSITINGAEFGYTMYSAGKNNGDAALPEEVILPTDENGVYPLEWELTFTVPYEDGKNTYNLTLDIDYSTGVKTNLAQKYNISIPVTIIVET